MKFEIDTRPETARFVVDGTPLNTDGIRNDFNLSMDSETGTTLTVTFMPQEIVYTDQQGVTWHVQADGGLTISGPAEAVKNVTGAL